MKVVLDNIIFSLQRAGGISAYWHELVNRMQRDSYLLRAIEHPKASANIFRQRITLDPECIVPEQRLPLCLSRYLPFRPVGGNVTLYHSSYYRRPAQTGVCNIITVYDFTYERFRKDPARRLHMLQKKAAVRAADGIICISESTKSDLLSFLPEIPEHKITVIHLAASGTYRPLSDADKVNRPTGLPDRPFVLFVGARDSYKNFLSAVQTVKMLPDYALVSAGGGPLTEMEKDMTRNLLPGRYVHFPSVDNEQLNRLYNCAHALLYASDYEGFGIPVLEAMAAGCPVVAVNSSSIPEVAGAAGLLADRSCPEIFSALIRKLEGDTVRNKMIKEGFARAARFSWDACYAETVEFYKNIAGQDAS